MSSTQVEDSTVSSQNYSSVSPPYSAVDFQAVHNIGRYHSIFDIIVHFVKTKLNVLFSIRIDQPSLPAVVVTQPAGVSLSTTVQFHRYRQQVICSACRQLIVTKTEHRISGGTWCMCCLIFFIGGFLCFFIPFLKKSCKDVVHRCPQCNAEIGRKTVM